MRHIRSRITHFISGWAIRVANPAMMGDQWSCSRDGRRTHYYGSYLDARSAARRAGDQGDLSGGFSII